MPAGEESYPEPKVPTADGEHNTYVNLEAKASDNWDGARKVIFINGMLNSPEDHVTAALALSLVQMCAVIGVYNRSAGGMADFLQCIGDKNQFNGPFSLRNRPPRMTAARAREALGRNLCQQKLFDLLRRPENRGLELFAHSQGNLILSNVLQAIVAVDGDHAITGVVVNTFGSPSVNWPPGLARYEQGFTFDPVSWLAGFDETWSISKLGMPSGSRNPITHAFLLYLQNDPAFVVNRFRIGGWGMTFNMDEDGLAACLAAMGGNLRRVRTIVDHLDKHHNSDADDVSVRYVALVRGRPQIVAALKGDRPLRDLLIKTMAEGWTSAEEKAAIEFLKSL